MTSPTRSSVVLAALMAAAIAAASPAAGAGSETDQTTASPTATTPIRSVLPRAGFAITFPPEWTVVVDDAARVEGERRPWVTATKASGARCSVDVIDPSTWLDLDDWVASARLTLESYGEPSVETVELPAGEGRLVELAIPAEETVLTSYVTLDERGYYGILCTSPTRAEDSWLHIVETLELIPGET